MKRLELVEGHSERFGTVRMGWNKITTKGSSVWEYMVEMPRIFEILVYIF